MATEIVKKTVHNLSRMNFSGHAAHVIIFCRMFTVARCLVSMVTVRVMTSVYNWLLVMHT